jgi:hypothetical protein
MPETADAGLVALQEGRDEAAVLASAAVDGPYGAAAPAPAARRRRRHRGWYRLVSPVAVVVLWPTRRVGAGRRRAGAGGGRARPLRWLSVAQG